MSIEPHNALTLSKPRIMPPKPEPKTPEPQMSMAEMARLENIATRRVFGAQGWGSYRQTEAHKRKMASRKDVLQRTERINKLVAFLAKGPKTGKELCEHMGISLTRLKTLREAARQRGHKIEWCKITRTFSLPQE